MFFTSKSTNPRYASPPPRPPSNLTYPIARSASCCGTPAVNDQTSPACPRDRCSKCRIVFPASSTSWFPALTLYRQKRQLLRHPRRSRRNDPSLPSKSILITSDFMYFQPATLPTHGISASPLLSPHPPHSRVTCWFGVDTPIGGIVICCGTRR